MVELPPLKDEKGATELCAYEIHKTENFANEILCRHLGKQNKLIRSKTTKKWKEDYVALPVQIAIEGQGNSVSRKKKN